MQNVIQNWTPINETTTPLEGIPQFRNSGIIKAVTQNGEKISIGQIDYEEFDDENYQYVISPFWDIIDGLTPDVFQGIPGIKMELRLAHYYRANYTPVFITERTPSQNREDLWELLEEVGLDYYDRFEWLLRTNMSSGNDNLIVERLREEPKIFKYSEDLRLTDSQYGDTVIVDSIKALAATPSNLTSKLLSMLFIGVDIVDNNNDNIISKSESATTIKVLKAQQELQLKYRKEKQQIGIEKAKFEGKYSGRKPIEVDDILMKEIVAQLDNNIIDGSSAMERLGLSSRSTFYRKLKKYRETH